MVDLYDPTRHPDVLRSKRTANEVLREFLESFDVGGEIEGHVTYKEFEDYYTNLGAATADDDEFECLIRNAWHTSEPSGPAKDVVMAIEVDEPKLVGVRKQEIAKTKGVDSMKSTLQQEAPEEVKRTEAVKTRGSDIMKSTLRQDGLDRCDVGLIWGLDETKGPKTSAYPRKFNPTYASTFSLTHVM